MGLSMMFLWGGAEVWATLQVLTVIFRRHVGGHHQRPLHVMFLVGWGRVRFGLPLFTELIADICVTQAGHN